MSARISRLIRQVRRAARRAVRTVDHSIYRDDPAGYARKVLGVEPWEGQLRVMQSCLEPPFRTLVPSGHDVGKTHTGAMLVSWWYDTRDPSVTLTTAPKLDQVRDLLWKEIRHQRASARPRLGGFPGPKSLRLESSPKHFAKGVTANTQAGFQGQHEEAVLVILDEAEGVDRDYWEAAKTMATGPGHAIVAFYNPYTTSSQAALEERATDRDGKASWRILPMSSLAHPNIAAELKGEPPPLPAAIRLAKVNQWVQDWCRPIDPHERQLTDLEWPPGSCQWWRPGPRFEAGALGRRPSTAVNSVWTDAIVDLACRVVLPVKGPLQLGCDVARFGDDSTSIHIRIGGVSVHHESANGRSLVETAQRLMQLACHYGQLVGLDGRQVPIAVDECGVGAGVVDILAADRWNVFGLNSALTAPDEERYPNLRSALWCDLSDEAARGNVCLAKLPEHVRHDLRRELTAPTYTLDARGRRVVEPKDRTKQRLGRSPDNADAFLLAYAAVDVIGERLAGRIEVATR